MASSLFSGQYFTEEDAKKLSIGAAFLEEAFPDVPELPKSKVFSLDPDIRRDFGFPTTGAFVVQHGEDGFSREVFPVGASLAKGAYGKVHVLQSSKDVAEDATEEAVEDAKDAKTGPNQGQVSEDKVLKIAEHATLKLIQEAEYEAEIQREVGGASCGFSVSISKEGKAISSTWMKKINGINLEKYAYKDEEDFLNVLIAVIKATLQFHEKYNLVHCDLKPANMFLITLPDGSYVVKFCDYGFTRRRNMLTNGRWAAPIEEKGKVIKEGSFYLPPETEKCIRAEFSIDYYSVGQFIFDAFRFDQVLYNLKTNTKFFIEMNRIFLLLVQKNSDELSLDDQHGLRKKITPRMMLPHNLLPENRINMREALIECEKVKNILFPQSGLASVVSPAPTSSVSLSSSALIASAMASSSSLMVQSAPPVRYVVDQVREIKKDGRLHFLKEQIKDKSLSTEIKAVRELVEFLRKFPAKDRYEVITLFASDQKQIDRLAQSYYLFNIMKNIEKQSDRLILLLRMNQEKLSTLLNHPLMLLEILKCFEEKAHEQLLKHLGNEVHFKKVLSNSNLKTLSQLFNVISLGEPVFEALMSNIFNDLKKVLKDGKELMGFLEEVEDRKKMEFLRHFTQQLIQDMSMKDSIKAIKDFLKFRDHLYRKKRQCYHDMLCQLAILREKSMPRPSHQEDHIDDVSQSSWWGMLFTKKASVENPAAITAFVNALQGNGAAKVQDSESLGEFGIILQEMRTNKTAPRFRWF